MKIKLFMWLVYDKKTITWDNIKKIVLRGLQDASSVRPKKKLWNIYSTAAFSFLGYGTFLLESFSNLIEKKGTLLIPSSIGEEIFRIMKFSAQCGLLHQASLYRTFRRRGTKEYLRMKICPHTTY